MDFAGLREAELRRHLARTAVTDAEVGCKAAVLVPFVAETDGWHLLFIRRAERADDEHSGQVAFPGGRMDPGDSGAVACALRETEEEIGVAAGRVQLLGATAVQHTRAGYPVQPVVGLLPWPTPLRPDPSEVAHCFTVPLAWLADAGNRRPVRFRTPGGGEGQVAGFREYRGEHVWGLTARIVLDVIARLETVATASAATPGTGPVATRPLAFR